MINEGLRDDQGMCRIRQEAGHHTLQSTELGGEPRRGFGVAVEPFLDELDLIAEVGGRGAESRRVEGGFFETDRTNGREQD